MSYRYEQKNYAHQEFPKWVKGVKGPQVVHDEDEEASVATVLKDHEEAIGQEKAARESAAKEQAISEMEEAIKRSKRK